MRRRRLCGADDDARSRVWAVSGGSDTIGLSYGPIGIVVSLGSGGRGVWAVNNAICCVSGHPMWDSAQPGRRHRAASVIRHDGGTLSPSGF